MLDPVTLAVLQARFTAIIEETGLRKFERFSHLPIEIRLKIWKHAFQPRVRSYPFHFVSIGNIPAFDSQYTIPS